MRRVFAALLFCAALTACNEKPTESTVGSTSTIPSTTDTTQTSTGGPGAEPILDPTDTTSTQYGGTTVTDTTTTTGTP